MSDDDKKSQAQYNADSASLVERCVLQTADVLDTAIGEAIHQALSAKRMALYVHVATRGEIPFETVTPEMVKDWPTAARYAIDADAHAAGVRAMVEQLIADHPVMIASVYSSVFGFNIMPRVEAQARSWFEENQSKTQPTHESTETRH